MKITLFVLLLTDHLVNNTHGWKLDTVLKFFHRLILSVLLLRPELLLNFLRSNHWTMSHATRPLMNVGTRRVLYEISRVLFPQSCYQWLPRCQWQSQRHPLIQEKGFECDMKVMSDSIASRGRQNSIFEKSQKCFLEKPIIFIEKLPFSQFGDQSHQGV